MARILSVNLGSATPTPAPGPGVTGIVKAPVDRVEVRAPGPKHGGLGSGVVGDYIGEREHHGGDAQAVYAVAREELDHWAAELGRDLPDGMFGENLTTSGLDVDGALVGEEWEVGDEVVLRVCGPRIPCRTFQTRMGERAWVRRFTAHGRSGAYLAVAAAGVIAAGDEVRVRARPGHGVDVMTAFRAFSGDLDAADRVLAARCLAPEDHEDLARTVGRRRGA